jgi:hypothetical protein
MAGGNDYRFPRIGMLTMNLVKELAISRAPDHYARFGQQGRRNSEIARFFGMVQNTVTLRRPNSVGNGLCPVPLAPERRIL